MATRPWRRDLRPISMLAVVGNETLANHAGVPVRSPSVYLGFTMLSDNGGEYYTPRPLIRTIVKVVSPQLGQTIFEGVVGSAGIWVEAFDYISDPANSGKNLLSVADRYTLQ